MILTIENEYINNQVSEYVCLIDSFVEKLNIAIISYYIGYNGRNMYETGARPITVCDGGNIKITNSKEYHDNDPYNAKKVQYFKKFKAFGGLFRLEFKYERCYDPQTGEVDGSRWFQVFVNDKILFNEHNNFLIGTFDNKDVFTQIILLYEETKKLYKIHNLYDEVSQTDEKL